MNWLERLPALVQPVAGLPDTWRARLEDGTAVTVRRYAETEPGRAAAALPRMRALAGLRADRLVPVRGAVPDGSGLSVIYDADLGRSLEEATGGRDLEPAAGVALGIDVFEALEAAHHAGQAHGEVSRDAIRLGADGHGRLWAFSPWADGSAEARQADVRAAAGALCAAMGIRLEWDASGQLRESERAAPAVAATLRAIARGSLPLDAAAATDALREAAGSLGADTALASARTGLAPAARPAAPRPIPPSVAVSLPPALSSRPRALAIAGAVVAAALILTGIGVVGWRTAGQHPRSSTAPSRSPSPAASASPTPPGTPLPPASSGVIRSVAETMTSACSPGTTCTIEVEVHFTRLSEPGPISWQFQLIDQCTQEVSVADGTTVNAKAGWTHVIGDTRVSLPAGHSLAVVAITQTPSQVSSAPLLVPGGSC